MVDSAKITELTHEGKAFYAYANVTGLVNAGVMTMLGRTGGTILESKRVYKSGVGSVTPGSGQIEGEWVLKSNSDYVFRITNNSGATINLDADFHFYEEEL